MKKFLTFLSLILLSTGCSSASINVEYNDGIYHAVLSGEKMKKQIQFVSTSGLKTNREAHNSSDSLFTINTGFFDPNNQKSISYIINPLSSHHYVRTG